MHPVVSMKFNEKEGLSIVVWKIERISQQEEPFEFSNTSTTPKDTILMQYTGLHDCNELTGIYEGDIININGEIVGNKYENDNLLKEKTNILIEGFGTETWRATEQKAVDRGCSYSE